MAAGAVSLCVCVWAYVCGGVAELRRWRGGGEEEEEEGGGAGKLLLTVRKKSGDLKSRRNLPGLRHSTGNLHKNSGESRRLRREMHAFPTVAIPCN